MQAGTCMAGREIWVTALTTGHYTTQQRKNSHLKLCLPPLQYTEVLQCLGAYPWRGGLGWRRGGRVHGVAVDRAKYPGEMTNSPHTRRSWLSSKTEPMLRCETFPVFLPFLYPIILTDVLYPCHTRQIC